MKYLLILLTIITSNSQSLELKASNELRDYEFFGRVQAQHQSQLSSLVEGQISKRYVDIGDYVNKDQILFSLDQYPQNFRLQSTEIEKDRLKNKLNFLRLKLSRRVKNDEAYTEEVVEEVQLQVQDTILQIQGIETNIALLKETLNKKKIKAPYDGVILQYHKDLGNFTTIASPIVSMMSIDDHFIRVSVNRIQARELHLNQKVSILVDHKILEGQILRIHPSEDQNHMRTIDVQLKSKDQFVVNQVLKVVIQLNKSMIKIPKGFVKSIHGVTTINIKHGKTNSLREVLGDFVFNDFISDNLALEGLILERF